MFKTIVDPYVGHVNLFKVLQGTVKTDATLVNGRTMHDERLHQLSVMRGKEQEAVSEVPTGDIAAVAKLADTTTGDVLGARGADIDVEPFEPPAPVLAIAIRAKSKSDEDKLANALHRLLDEDPALRLERNAETHQTLLWGQGETHLGIALERLHRKLGVEVETEDVKVAYRETITHEAEAEGKYKKQTGGHGQFGVAFVRVEPLERGGGFEFVDQIVGGAIPRQFIPAVEKGVARDDGARRRVRLPRRRREGDLLRRQVPLGRLVGDELQDGGVDRLQGGDGQGRPDPARAGQRARRASRPRRTRATSWATSTRSGAASRARARSGNGEVEVVALVPTSEVLRYTIDLRSMTGGRGRFTASATRTTTRCRRTWSTRCGRPPAQS